ncbi:hypothetical protein GYM22_003675 [Escherichia coli]|nr:hypothetical protein [Escherichia coli]EFE8621301.1 hypothetical protein [Escherichia coli O103]EFH8522918.1 hypothetical protein [Escherichia coli]EFI3717491.1 hypothetical protein [Escherichia coli]EFI4042171.1 hypothetical protein [Escherichia coli]
MRHNACLLSGEALTCQLLRLTCQGLGLNKCLTRGLSTSGLQVHPPAISRKAPAHNLRSLP